jgi:hypothetical protein
MFLQPNFTTFQNADPSPFAGFQGPSMHGYPGANRMTTNASENKPGNITIDDIINALQSARNDALRDSRQERAPESLSVRPIDLNKSRTVFVVAKKLFASGKVWEPVKMSTEENLMELEMKRLVDANPGKEYKIHQLQWMTVDDDKKGEKGGNGKSTSIDTDSDDDISFDDSDSDAEADAPRGVHFVGWG